MRKKEEIKNLILEKARTDDRIRAVLLNGSRANKIIKKDKYQDFDIVYIVTDIESFISDHGWVNFFGERIMSQLPDEMSLGHVNKKKSTSFAYLMLFADGNRIDLTLAPKEKVNAHFHLDSLTITWLDKDKMFSENAVSSESDYLIRRPSEEVFIETCNEFWWVCTYVAKGLARNEIPYAKQMLENIVRPMFMKVIEWYIGANTDFSVSFGKCGRFMKNHLSKKMYERILRTYADYELKNNWKALFTMTELFGDLARHVSAEMNFDYNAGEDKNVNIYLRMIRKN